MLWFLLLLIIALVVALFAWNAKRDREWRGELLYLTRHEGERKEPEVQDREQVEIASAAQRVRHNRTAEETFPDDAVPEPEKRMEPEPVKDLEDLPIFAHAAEETGTDADAEASGENQPVAYFYPEEITVPFEEQFKPVLPDPEESEKEPEVVVLNTQIPLASPIQLHDEPEDETLPVIELNEIRTRLAHKQTLVKKKKQRSEQEKQPATLPVIDSEEVWANLAKTDSPAPKLHAQRHMVEESVIPVAARVAGDYGQILKAGKDSQFAKIEKPPISTRFTPFTHRADSVENQAYSRRMIKTEAAHLFTGQQILNPEAVQKEPPVLNRVVTDQHEPVLLPEGFEVNEKLSSVENIATGDSVFHPENERLSRSEISEPVVFSDYVSVDAPVYDADAPVFTFHDEQMGVSEESAFQAIEQMPVLESITLVDVPKEPEAGMPTESAFESMQQQPVSVEPETPPMQPKVQPAPQQAPSRIYSAEFLPDLSLLHPPEMKSNAALSEEALLENGIVIEEKLAEFKVKVSVVEAYAGPVVTRYEIEPAVGVRGSQVVNLVKDLARALGLISIRVVETIPGKTCMGLELPNPKRQMIRLSEILSEPVFQESRSKLTLALGQDITGQPIVTDLAKAPHLLVAGTTGSGKSVGVNAMILSMLYKATPEEVRLIMIDPKMLELSIYEGIPHLLAPVVTDMKLAANALTWCVNEMEKRYRLMSYFGVRNLVGFNQKIKEAHERGQKLGNPFSLTPETPEPLEHLPYIVVVVDEFADLMMVAGKKIEELIARLAQKARAAGIHLILATQRPSVDVITGLIKANIPTRIAFQVSSKIDSRTILDQMGAESLLGQGDMLFLPPGTGYPQRVHGAFVADDEVHRVVTYLKQFGEPDYVADILTSGVGEDDLFSNANSARNNTEDDPLYDEAVAIVLRTRKASISSVQRQLRIGYNRAARLIEQMEASGIVSPMENNGNRTVLVPDRDSD